MVIGGSTLGDVAFCSRCSLLGVSGPLWGRTLRPFFYLLWSKYSHVSLCIKMENSQLHHCHVCLDVAMLSPLIIIDWNIQPIRPNYVFFFVRFALIMVTLHSNGNPKTEIVTRDWGIGVIELTIVFFRKMYILGLRIWKSLENVKWGLMGPGNGTILQYGPVGVGVFLCM